MSDSTASIYDSSFSHLPGAGSQVLLGRYNLCSSKLCKGVGGSYARPLMDFFQGKCSFSFSLPKNVLVSSLTLL